MFRRWRGEENSNDGGDEDSNKNQKLIWKDQFLLMIECKMVRTERKWDGIIVC